MSKNRFGEAANRRRVAPGGGEPPVTEVEVKEEIEEVVVEEPKTVVSENPLAGMIEPKQKGKPCGFYLSSEAIDNLERLAKQNRCSKSKALDALLKNL